MGDGQPGTRPYRVLILEDIAETRDWLRAILQEAYGEVDVETAAMLREARAMVDDGYDLALLDLGLPDRGSTCFGS